MCRRTSIPACRSRTPRSITSRSFARRRGRAACRFSRRARTTATRPPKPMSRWISRARRRPRIRSRATATTRACASSMRSMRASVRTGTCSPARASAWRRSTTRASRRAWNAFRSWWTDSTCRDSIGRAIRSCASSRTSTASSRSGCRSKARRRMSSTVKVNCRRRP